jgi:hypothetical protein
LNALEKAKTPNGRKSNRAISGAKKNGKRSIGIMAGPTGGYKVHAFEQRLVRGVPESGDHCRLSCGIKGCSGPAGLLWYLRP